MTHALTRLGAFATRRPRTVVASWLALLVLAVAASAGAAGETTDDVTVSGLESVEVARRIAAEVPTGRPVDSDSVDVVVRTVDGRPFSAHDREVVHRLAADLAARPHVAEVTDPFVVQRAAAAEGIEVPTAVAPLSRSGHTAIVSITLEADLDAIPRSQVDALKDELAEATSSRLEVLPPGDLSLDDGGDSAVVELAGLAIAGVVLFIMLRTARAALVPLASAAVGVGVSLMLTSVLAAFVVVMSAASALGLMLGLAVGIDYALFVLQRHRTQVRVGMSIEESIPLAVGAAGSTVVFAGLTVASALLALNAAGPAFLGSMGTVAALFVAVAVLVTLTLTPALLALAGARILSRHERLAPERRTNGVPGGSTADARRVPVMVGSAAFAVLTLFVAAWPSLDLRLGLPADDAQAESTTAYRAFHATSEEFGAGRNGPVVALADLPAELGDAVAARKQKAIVEALVAHRSVESVVPIGLSPDNTRATFQVTPVDGPSAASTEALVHDLRSGDVLSGTDAEDVQIAIAGLPAAAVEVTDVVADALPRYVALVLAMSLLVMIVVFRSLLLPVIAIVGFVASFAGALGVVVATFQWGWLHDLFATGDPGPVLTFLPVIALGVLFGLAIDYQLFTAVGMREAYLRGVSPHEAVRDGLRSGRAVVTAAALIMASVFAGFALSPDPTVAPLGLGLAAGVVLDAFAVRLVLVPALLHLCGGAAWWLPAWLDRVLPRLDVEGDAVPPAVSGETGTPA